MNNAEQTIAQPVRGDVATLRVPASLHRRLKRAAIALDTPVHVYATRILEAHTPTDEQIAAIIITGTGSN